MIFNLAGAAGRRAVFFAVTLLTLAGCSGFPGRPAPRIEMAESTYAAADRLIQQSRHALTQSTPLKIGTLQDMDKPGEESALGQMLAGQIGARFVQLGYNVTVSSFETGPDQGMMAASVSPADGYGYGAGMTAGGAEISGQYVLARSEAMVNLRIVETGTGRILAACDYSIPLNADIKHLAKTRSEKDSVWFSF